MRQDFSLNIIWKGKTDDVLSIEKDNRDGKKVTQRRFPSYRRVNTKTIYATCMSMYICMYLCVT